jgi:uncharacterized protein (TIGR02271 family)
LTADRDDETLVGAADRLPDPTEATLIRFEEEADARPGGWRGSGFLRARKRVETATVDEAMLRNTQDVVLERVQSTEEDAGGVLTLPDGGVSIPIYEERLVVRKEVVLKERLIVRKKIVTQTENVQSEIQREQVEVKVDDSIADRVEWASSEAPGSANNQQ